MSDAHRSSFWAALIAGGKSTRLGQDKRVIPFAGQLLWRRQMELLNSLGADQVVISGPVDGPWSGSGFEVIPDTVNDAGPLGGLASVLARTSAGRVLVLAVDLPCMSAGFLRTLTETRSSNVGVVPVLGDRFEPLAAVYPASCRPLAEAQLKAGMRSLQGFVKECLRANLVRARAVNPREARYFFNLNEPADLAGGPAGLNSGSNRASNFGR